MHSIALVVHLFGALLWVGSTTSLAWTAATLVSRGETKALSAVRTSLLLLAAPGLLLAWAGALAMLVPGWSTYAHLGWIHGKLTIGLVLSGLHGALVAKIRRAAAGTSPVTPAFLVGVATAYLVLALAAVALAVLHPGG